MGEALLEIISYPVGWCVCRLLTFGRYPKGTIIDNALGNWAYFGITLIGLLTLALIVVIIFHLV